MLSSLSFSAQSQRASVKAKFGFDCRNSAAAAFIGSPSTCSPRRCSRRCQRLQAYSTACQFAPLPDWWGLFTFELGADVRKNVFKR